MKLEQLELRSSQVREFLKKHKLKVSEVLLVCADLTCTALANLPAADREPARRWFLDRLEAGVKVMEKQANA